MATPPAHASRSRRRGCSLGLIAIIASLILLVVVVVLGVGGGVAYWLWSSEPAYWQANEQFKASIPREQRELIAERAEQRVLSTLSRVSRPPFAADRRPAPTNTDTPAAAAPSASPTPADDDDPDIRIVELTYQEVNAWLAERLDDLLANQGESMPAHLSNPMVAAEGEFLVAAFRYTTPQLEQVVSLVLDLELQPDGKARARVVEIRGGKLPLPIEELSNQLRTAAADEVDGEQIDRLVRAIEGETFDPIVKLDPTRQARLIDYALRSDGATLTFHLEPRED